MITIRNYLQINNNKFFLGILIKMTSLELNVIFWNTPHRKLIKCFIDGLLEFSHQFRLHKFTLLFRQLTRKLWVINWFISFKNKNPYNTKNIGKCFWNWRESLIMIHLDEVHVSLNHGFRIFLCTFACTRVLVSERAAHMRWTAALYTERNFEMK